LILALSVSLAAQDRPSYKIFCPDNNHQPFGIFIGGGGSFTSADPLNPTFQSAVTNTTAYQLTLDSRGVVGYGGEIGAVFIPRRTFIRMIDFGFNYRQFNGGEVLRGVRSPGGDLSFPEVLTYEGRFKYHRASFRMNFQSVVPLGYRSYLHLGPGLFIDETIGQKSSYDIDLISVNTEIPDKPSSTSVNFTIGLGFKVGNGRFIDFYGQAPIMSFSNDKLFDTREEIFNSSYSNTYIGVRFFWMKGTPDRICPAMSRGKSGSRLSKKRLQSDFYPW
jgi:hypothetical protein